MTNSPDGLIILSRLTVQNANTISSPLTWGFPAINAILGFVHALERKLKVQYSDLKLGGVGVICHKFEPQVIRTTNISDRVFSLTRNPVFTKKQFEKFNNEGTPPAFVEEGRAHMQISLVIQAYGDIFFHNDEQKKDTAVKIFNSTQSLRLAGGSIFKGTRSSCQLMTWPDSYDEQVKESKKILRRLLPGFVLINREDLLAERTKNLKSTNPEATALDALLEFSSLNYEPEITDIEADKSDWIIQKKPGWLVPIPVGFAAISELYEPRVVANARDNTYPFCFVENIYSLGQWLSPHRIKAIEDIFWYYHFDEQKQHYRCINNPTKSISNLNQGENHT